MKKNKILLISISIIIVFSLYLVIDSLIFNMKNKDNLVNIRINYIVIDYDKSKNIKIDENKKYYDYLVDNYVTITKATKKGDYYYAKADNINKNFYKGKFMFPQYAMNDVDGNVINGCYYDYKTKQIKIPKKYFTKKNLKEYDNVPVKVDLLTRIKEKDYKKLKVKGKIKKIFIHNNEMKVINQNELPKLTLFKNNFGRYINKKDFKIYINNKETLLSSDSYSYNQKTGVLSFEFPLFYTNDYYIVFKKSSVVKNYLFSIFRPFTNVKAINYKKIKGTMSLSDDAVYSDFNNKQITKSFTYYYRGSSGYVYNGTYHSGSIPNSVRSNSISIIPPSISDSRSKNNGDFYIKVNKFTIKNGDKTLKVNLAGSYQWLHLYCTDGSRGGSYPDKLNIRIRTEISGSNVIFHFDSMNYVTSQYAHGSFYMNKTKERLYKIVIQKGHPTAESPNSPVAWPKQDIVFRLYSSTCSNSGNCSDMVAEESTDSHGRVTFNNLKRGNYWVKEIFKEYAFSSSLSGNYYYRDADCLGVNTNSSDMDNEDKVLQVCAGPDCVQGSLVGLVIADDADPDYNPGSDIDDNTDYEDDSNDDDNSDDDDYELDNSMIGDFYPYCNVKKHYKTSVKKVDYDTNESKSGFTFRFSNGTDVVDATTDSNGVATFCGIKEHYDKDNNRFRAYTISEIGQLPQYWGLTSNPLISVPATQNQDDIDEILTTDLVAYPFNEGCSSVSTHTIGTAKNNRKFYCMKVKKVDKDTGKVLTGAEFEATGSGLTLNKNSSLTYGSSKNIYQESNGVTTFLTSIYDSPFSIRETKAPEGYAASTDVKSVTPTLINQNKSWSEIGFSDCSANADTFTYEDTALTINWFKINEDGHQINSKDPKELNGAEFKVRNSSGQYITVSEPGSETDPKSFTTDTTGKQKLCYTYTGTSDSGSKMYSMNTRTKASKTSAATDTDGEVCVRGLPEGDYTIEEIRPAHYHTFGNTKYKNIKTYKDFRNRIVNESDFTNSGKSIYGDNTYINEETDFEFDKSVLNKDSSQEGDVKYTITKNGVTKTMSLSELTTEELKLITFRIFDSNGTALSFVQKTDEKGTYYDFVGNTLDGPGTAGATTDLHLDNGRNFRVKHLDWAQNYAIREVDSSNCQINTSGYNSFVNPSSRPASAQSCSNSSGGGSGDCIGYYSPDYSSDVVDKFYISECTSDLAYSCGKYGRYKKGLENKPTEVTLTKKDFYHYDDSADIIDKDRKKDSKESQAEFENDKERSDFDRIDFKVKDPSGNYLNFIYLGKSGDCKSDSSYSIYRYTPGLSLQPGISPDTFNSEIGGTTQTLHACGGHIKILNLCRGNKYTFEEVKVPDDSVYVLENSTDTPTSTCFTIPCTEGEPTPSSETHIINDKGTRIRFEKRDSKYNYLIPDERVTFRVYRCPKGMSKEECHPSQFGTIDSNNGKLVIDESKITENGYKLMKFSPRAILNNDREDGAYSNNVNTAKAENVENNYQVYLAMSDSDSENLNECSNDLGDSNCYVTNLHPDHGVLILRYLQATGNAEYNYVLVETASPKNYLLPVGTDGETPFTISNQTVKIDSVDDPNVPTALLIKKYSSETGNLLAGAEFKIYKAEHSCDANLKPWAQTPLTELKLKTIKDGVYEARPEEDTSIVKTCTDLDGFKCSDIPVNPTTKLTYGIDTNGNNTATNILNENINNQYVDSYADFKNLKTEDDKSLLLQEGEALIQYLEYNTCYVIEEVKAPEGHSLPSKKNDRYTMIEIKENEQFGKSTEFTFKNTPTPFTFYKFDEYNQLLDGAEFKLQKLNDDKIYEDIAVEKVEKEDGSLFYKALGLLKKVENGETAITTKNGSATVYYLTAGQYRIVETKPAPGKALNKNPNIATFFVDDSGNTYGESIITNKPGTIQSSSVSPASAKLVVNIQTGMIVIKYGFIITLIIAIIAGLMLLKRKTK